MLQRSLLPERLPTIPGVAFASRYTPGGSGLQVGGDWYDVIELPRGCIGLTVGDVVGRGLTAAATMGQLRTAIRAYALENPSPASVLEQMSRLVGQLEAGQMATVVYAVLDPGSETLTYASAGHPAPLLLGPDGTATYLEGGRSMPLGVAPGARPEAVTAIEPGSTLILYTDGLIERRGHSIDEGLETLRRAVEASNASLNELCDEGLVASGRRDAEDDVAVLATKLLPVSADLSLVLPAEPEEVASVRTALRSWAVHWGATVREADDLVHAVSEAASNVVEHAYGAASGTIELHAIYDAGFISVTVRDQGCWRPPRDTGQGRGLQLIRGLVHDVDVVCAERGTEVRMQYVLGRAAKTGRATVPGATAPASLETDGQVDVVRLSGDVDIANAMSLFHEVIAQIRSRSIGAAVDLSEVDHLDSAGIRLLFRVAARLAPRRQTLCVVATPGSAVDRILRMSGFDRYSQFTPSIDAAIAAIRANEQPSDSLEQGT
jgi:anti-anti-sigma factor